MLSVNCGIHMTARCQIVVFAILRFSPEIKNEVRCFSVNVQYSTELKDNVQNEEGKIKMLNESTSAKYFCVSVMCKESVCSQSIGKQWQKKTKLLNLSGNLSKPRVTHITLVHRMKSCRCSDCWGTSGLIQSSLSLPSTQDKTSVRSVSSQLLRYICF